MGRIGLILGLDWVLDWGCRGGEWGLDGDGLVGGGKHVENRYVGVAGESFNFSLRDCSYLVKSG